MTAAERARGIVRSLEETGDRSRVESMARYGIDTSRAVGVSVTELRRIARGLGRDHELAAALWGSGVHEARILASLVDDSAKISQAQMDAWVADLDSWDVCDGVCGNLFDRTPFALAKAVEWSAREPEFDKRAGFALMASAAVHRKDLPDSAFGSMMPVIREGAIDDRKLRDEGRLLGSAADRKAEPRAQHPDDPDGRTDRPTRHTICEVDRPRRLPRAFERRRPSSPPEPLTYSSSRAGASSRSCGMHGSSSSSATT